MILAALLWLQVLAPPPTTGRFVISGTVLNAITRVPLSGARVTVAGPSGPPREQTAGKDGKFEFDSLPAGRYRLSAACAGYWTAYYQQHGSLWTGIIARPGLSTTGFLLTLNPEAVLHGVVRDASGDPVRGASVTLFRRDPESSKPPLVSGANTDDEGDYEISPLQPAEYYIAVTAMPWYNVPAWPPPPPRPQHGGSFFFGGPMAMPTVQSGLDVFYPVTFSGDVTDSAAAQPIDLSSGGVVTADLELNAVPALHLTLHTAPEPSGQGRSIPQIFPMAFGQRLFGANIDRVEMRPAADGSLDVYVSLPPGLYEVQQQNLPPVPISMQNDQEMAAALAAPPPLAEVTGILDSSDGGPPPKGLPLFLRSPGYSWSSHTDQAGRFDFSHVPPGDYELRTRTEPVTRFAVNGQPVEIHAVLAAVQSVPIVRGMALRAGRGVSGVLIVLATDNPADWSDAYRDQSDSDGSFKLANVRAGRYRLIAVDGGFDLLDTPAEFLRRYASHAPKVVIPSGAREFTLKPVTVQPSAHN